MNMNQQDKAFLTAQFASVNKNIDGVKAQLEEKVTKTMKEVEKNRRVIITNQETLGEHGTDLKELQNKVKRLESGQQDQRRRGSKR